MPVIVSGTRYPKTNIGTIFLLNGDASSNYILSCPMYSRSFDIFFWLLSLQATFLLYLSGKRLLWKGQSSEKIRKASK